MSNLSQMLMKIFSTSSNSSHKETANRLRKSLLELKTPLFPNGIYGQIGISFENDEWQICLPFLLSEYEFEVKNELRGLVSEPIVFQYLPPKSIQTKVNNVKMLIAVASGKGGVGKSTVTANLAVTLSKLGHKVGIVDADIYGPSMPIMFGQEQQSISSRDGKTMIPIESHGVFLNSIGFLVPKEKATVWRGPMASRALTQLINETNWPELDILLVDMPPGTGDIQLTMSQTIKCDGAVIVTTPQNVALADAEKGINMFQKVDTPILGVVENMSHFVCNKCGTDHDLFGTDGGKHLSENFEVPLLCQLPLDPTIRRKADEGVPAALDKNNQYAALAFSLMMQASKQTDSLITLG